MASFKEKLENIIYNSASGITQPVVELEESPSHKVAGFIISDSFLNMDQLDRQNKIWNYLENILSPDELPNIVSLVTVTPDEADIN